jgi:hypothetical protein
MLLSLAQKPDQSEWRQYSIEQTFDRNTRFPGEASEGYLPNDPESWILFRA